MSPLLREFNFELNEQSSNYVLDKPMILSTTGVDLICSFTFMFLSFEDYNKENKISEVYSTPITNNEF